MRTTALLVLLAAATLAHAQIVPPQPQPTPPPDLSGPKVQTPAQELTLIKQDMQTGMVVRLDATPEEAALDLVNLSPAERQAVDKILAERAALLDKVVADNIAKFLKYQGIRETDTPRERMQALTELARATAPIRKYEAIHGPPLNQLTAVIAPEKAAVVRSLVTSYREALFRETQATMPPNPRHDTEEKRNAAIRGREALLALGGELKRSYERQIAAKTEQLNELITKLNCTPEQEAKIRAAAADFAQKSLGKPTTEHRRELFRSIITVLDDTQKMALFAALYNTKPQPLDDTKAPQPAPAPSPAPAPAPKP